VKRRLPAPLIAALAVLAVLATSEALARIHLSANPLPDSYDAKCITTHERGFEPYTRPRERPTGERLLIVISNSQGQLTWNEPDPGPSLFPALLEKSLGPGTRVLNWSVVGGNGSEMTVLVARAAAHRPDAVLIAAGALNFRREMAVAPLSETGSDVEALAYLPAVRRHLPARFLERHAVHEMPGFLSAHVGLVQWRHRFVEQRTGNWTPTTAGQADGRFLDDLREGRVTPGRYGTRQAEAWSPESDALLEDLRATLRSGAPDARLVIASQPVCTFVFDEASQEAISSLAPAATRLFGDDPNVRVVNLLGKVPPQNYFTWSHVGRRGHERIAALLLPHARWALGE
jgi:hypothetical protein